MSRVFKGETKMRIHALKDRRRPGGAISRRTSGPARPRGGEPVAPLRAPADVVAIREDLLQPDADLSRAQRAGGPEDNASYACSCGLVFAASVSTSVACPHCGVAQAW